MKKSRPFAFADGLFLFRTTGRECIGHEQIEDPGPILAMFREWGAQFSGAFPVMFPARLPYPH